MSFLGSFYNMKLLVSFKTRKFVKRQNSFQFDENCILILIWRDFLKLQTFALID